jgi:predicted MFS family arabinose efflux permease
MAAATGLAVANIYYNQPMLGVMERDMPGPLTAFVPMTTQLGYALGLFILVPLGDLFERRRLIAWQFLALALALTITALAPSGAILLLGSLCTGAAACVAQQIVPLAAHLASPERRGATVGTVMSGLLCGILLSRTLAGFVADHAGWRAMFWIGVPLALGAGAAMASLLPDSRPETRQGYGRLVMSLFDLWRDFPQLRRAAYTQACQFGAFSVFWSILALHLQEPRFSLSAGIAGLFGVIGATGILAAPLAGRIADGRGPRGVIFAASALSLVSWGIIGLVPSLAGLTAGCILLDFAVQSSLVSNQHIVYALRPEARARLNTLFMGVMFLGGAAGAAGASVAWSHGGWNSVSLFGALMAAGALLQQLSALRPSTR